MFWPRKLTLYIFMSEMRIFKTFWVYPFLKFHNPLSLYAKISIANQNLRSFLNSYFSEIHSASTLADNRYHIFVNSSFQHYLESGY